MCTDDKYRAPKTLSKACVDNKHATERTQVSDTLHVHIKTLLCAHQKQSPAGTQKRCVCLKEPCSESRSVLILAKGQLAGEGLAERIETLSRAHEYVG